MARPERLDMMSFAIRGLPLPVGLRLVLAGSPFYLAAADDQLASW